MEVETQQAQEVNDDEHTEVVPGRDENRTEDARELRLTRRMFGKHGWSPQCPGCTAMEHRLPQRAHTAACRERMYLAMQDNEEDRELVTRAVLRQQEAQDQAIRRSSLEGGYQR